MKSLEEFDSLVSDKCSAIKVEMNRRAEEAAKRAQEANEKFAEAAIELLCLDSMIKNLKDDLSKECQSLRIEMNAKQLEYKNNIDKNIIPPKTSIFPNSLSHINVINTNTNISQYTQGGDFI